MPRRTTIRVYQMNRYLTNPHGAEMIIQAVDQAVAASPGGHIALDFQSVHQMNGDNMDHLVRHIRELLAQPQTGRLAFTFENTSGNVARWAQRCINQHRVAVGHHQEKRRPTPLEQAQWWRNFH